MGGVTGGGKKADVCVSEHEYGQSVGHPLHDLTEIVNKRLRATAMVVKIRTDSTRWTRAVLMTQH